MFNKCKKFLTIKNDLAYWERSYDRNTVIEQATGVEIFHNLLYVR